MGIKLEKPDAEAASAKYSIRNPVRFSYEAKKGLDEKVVREISAHKNEPDWMLSKRLASLKLFKSKPMPNWGPGLEGLDLEDITHFVRPEGHKTSDWKELPSYIKNTFDKLGIPEAERNFLAGAGAMYESEVVYKGIRKNLEEQGVIYTDTDSAVQEYPELVKKYFMTRCVPAADNKFAALHGALWSGGSFVYVPAGVKVSMPLQIYFLMNHPAFGQYEHTLIIAEPGSQVQYIEGCSAPLYAKSSLHSAVVEIFVKRGAKVRYTSIQNWSKNVYNLNTKRSIVEENGVMEWVGGTLGSGLTMLYPCSVLAGRGARAEHMNVAFAGSGQVKDNGAKVIHLAPDTTSSVVSKSICKAGGWANYRGLLSIARGCRNSKASVRCDALMLDPKSHSSTQPVMDIREKDVTVGHEATAGRISEEQLFYLQSRGISKDEATALIVRGFIEPVTKLLPLEYAVEFNRMIELEMEGKGVVG
ncbi:MAG: Fe-S cluster assembly protein SufB [Candidatus Micrarchaeia archaeon]